MPAGPRNAAQKGGGAPDPQRPATGARKEEDAEGELKQEKAAGLIARRGCHQVEGCVEEVQRLRGEARGCAPPWAGTMDE